MTNAAKLSFVELCKSVMVEQKSFTKLTPGWHMMEVSVAQNFYVNFKHGHSAYVHKFWRYAVSSTQQLMNLFLAWLFCQLTFHA